MKDQGTSYRCACCHVRVEDDHSPFVAQTVTGPAELHPDSAPGEVDGTLYALPTTLRMIRARQTTRMTWCSTCYAWHHGEDLVSGPVEAPVVIVKHADHATRATFGAAAQAYHEQQATARAERKAAAEQARLAAAATAATTAIPATRSAPAPDAPPAMLMPATPDTPAQPEPAAS